MSSLSTWFYYLMFGEKYILWSSSWCNFCYPPVMFSLLGSNILPSTLISNTFHLCSSFAISDKISQPQGDSVNNLNIHCNMKFHDLRMIVALMFQSQRCRWLLCWHGKYVQWWGDIKWNTVYSAMKINISAHTILSDMYNWQTHPVPKTETGPFGNLK